jgi:hypothetical protein
LISLISATTEFLIVYLSTGNMIFYYCYLATLFFALFYGLRLYRKYVDFRQNLYLFLPNSSEKQLEPLEMNLEDQDIPLKVCLYYRNGATFEEIKQNLNLSHPTQARRELIKGLDILLKEHGEKHESKIHER